MKRKVFAAMAITAAALTGTGDLLRATTSNSAEVIIEWNQTLQETVPNASLMTPRFFSMMHIAMFDAVNAVDNEYTPYLTKIRGLHGASAEAAAAQAARDVLVALIPGSQATYDARLEAQLADIPHGRARLGKALGRKAAARVLEWRANDGWEVTPPVYEPPAITGVWQRTPPGNAASFTQFPGAVPFALPTATIFLPPPPPQLNSAKYAEDFNEVKLYGSQNSAVRSAEQTLRSRLFAGVVTRTTLWAMWNNVTRDAVRARDLSLVDAARLFVLVNVSINDAVQTSHASKFVYQLWRPVTAIRRADEDLNDDTVPDAGWTPLIVTPTYPSYAGNMASVGASAAAVLGLALGSDDFPVTVLWLGSTGQPDITRNFSGFWELAQAQADSRVHGGIHYRFDNVVGQQSAVKVATFVFNNFMLPRKGD
jgi:hypothetical protein